MLISFLFNVQTNTRNKGTDDLFIGFDRARNRSQEELTNKKIEKRKLHVGNMLKDVFSFAEHHQKLPTASVLN